MNLSTFGHTGKFFLATPGKIHYPPHWKQIFPTLMFKCTKNFEIFCKFCVQESYAYVTVQNLQLQ